MTDQALSRWRWLGRKSGSPAPSPRTIVQQAALQSEIAAVTPALWSPWLSWEIIRFISESALERDRP